MCHVDVQLHLSDQFVIVQYVLTNTSATSSSFQSKSSTPLRQVAANGRGVRKVEAVRCWSISNTFHTLGCQCRERDRERATYCYLPASFSEVTVRIGDEGTVRRLL